MPPDFNTYTMQVFSEEKHLIHIILIFDLVQINSRERPHIRENTKKVKTPNNMPQSINLQARNLETDC